MADLSDYPRRSMTTSGLVKVTITITREQDVLLDQLAAESQVSRSFIVRQVIADGFKVLRVKQAAGAAAVTAVAS